MFFNTSSSDAAISAKFGSSDTEQDPIFLSEICLHSSNKAFIVCQLLKVKHLAIYSNL